MHKPWRSSFKVISWCKPHVRLACCHSNALRDASPMTPPELKWPHSPLGSPQPTPQAFSARSNLDPTVSCDVTERDSPLLPTLRADDGARENAWGLDWGLPYLSGKRAPTGILLIWLLPHILHCFVFTFHVKNNFYTCIALQTYIAKDIFFCVSI